MYLDYSMLCKIYFKSVNFGLRTTHLLAETVLCLHQFINSISLLLVLINRTMIDFGTSFA